MTQLLSFGLFKVFIPYICLTPEATYRSYITRWVHYINFLNRPSSLPTTYLNLSSNLHNMNEQLGLTCPRLSHVSIASEGISIAKARNPLTYKIFPKKNRHIYMFQIQYSSENAALHVSSLMPCKRI